MSWAGSDEWISKHLGMDKDEILRLKQITGLTSLFKDVNFGRHGGRRRKTRKRNKSACLLFLIFRI